MANKTIQKKKIRRHYEQVDITIDKNAFNGPFTCHNQKTIKVNKTMKLGNIKTDYSVWECPKCKEEYLDPEQSKVLERIWTMEKMLDKKGIEIERKINYDGKAYFLRFPKDITKNWKKGSRAEIIVLNSNEFFVKVIN